jgi:hypothetical protein
MTHRLHQANEPTYGETRAIEHLTAVAETLRGVIIHEVTDRNARTAALLFVGKALDAAVQGVATI